MLRDRITTEVFDLWECYERRGIRHSISHLLPALPALVSGKGKYRGNDLIEWLQQQTTDSSIDISTRTTAVMALGLMAETAGESPAMRATLVKIVMEMESREAQGDLYSQSLIALEAMGVQILNDDELRKTLLNLIAERSERGKRAATILERTFRKTSGHPEAIGRLLQLFDETSQPDLRRRAVLILRHIGHEIRNYPEILEASLWMLKAANSDVRNDAMTMLIWLGKHAARKDIVLALLEMLKQTNDVGLQRQIFAAFGEMGEAAAFPEVTDLLISQALVTDDNILHRPAADALGKMSWHVDLPPTVLDLVTQDTNYRQRARAADLLACMVDTAQNRDAIIDTLCKEFKQTLDFSLQASYAEALWVIAAKGFDVRIVDTLVFMIKERNIYCRQAVDALARIGEAAASANVLDALLQLISPHTNIDPLVRAQALKAVGNMGQRAVKHSGILPAIRNALDAIDQPEIRIAAVQAGANLGPLLADSDVWPGIVPVLLGMLEATVQPDLLEAADSGLLNLMQTGIRISMTSPTIRELATRPNSIRARCLV